MLKPAALAVFAAFAVPIAAHAQQPLPQYDVNAKCGARGGAAYVRACWKMEQDAYDTLKASWGQIPERFKPFCVQRANIRPFANYSVLEQCLSNFMAAHQYDDARPFHP